MPFHVVIPALDAARAIHANSVALEAAPAAVAVPLFPPVGFDQGIEISMPGKMHDGEGLLTPRRVCFPTLDARRRVHAGIPAEVAGQDEAFGRSRYIDHRREGFLPE